MSTCDCIRLIAMLLFSKVMRMYDMNLVANRIFLARKNKGLKQIEVCNFLDIGQSTYSDIETGKRDITLPVLFKLSELLDVSITWLLGIDSDLSLTDKEILELEKFKRYIVSIRTK